MDKIALTGPVRSTLSTVESAYLPWPVEWSKMTKWLKKCCSQICHLVVFTMSFDMPKDEKGYISHCNTWSRVYTRKSATKDVNHGKTSAALVCVTRDLFFLPWSQYHQRKFLMVSLFQTLVLWWFVLSLVELLVLVMHTPSLVLSK